MQGFDAPLQGLQLIDASDTEASWSFRVGPHHANIYGSLHGGCTATLVDVLGSALVAMGNSNECGVATNLDVQYCAGAAVGRDCIFKAKLLKRGKRLVTVKVSGFEVRSGGIERLVAMGTVTKSLAGYKPSQST